MRSAYKTCHNFIIVYSITFIFSEDKLDYLRFMHTTSIVWFNAHNMVKYLFKFLHIVLYTLCSIHNLGLNKN